MLRQITFASVLAASLCGSAVAATDQWLEVASPHFTVATDSSEKQARRIADQFERMRWMFQKLYPYANVDPAQPIVVLLAKNDKSFAAFEPAEYLAKGQIKLGGLFLKVQDKNYVLLRLDAESEHPYAAVYHEYTHLAFSGDNDWLPLWLNEGLAEFTQNTEFRNKDVLLGQPSRDDLVYLRQSRIIPLDVLFKVDEKSPYYHEEEKGSVFYAESWALTHFLEVTDHEKGTHRLNDYLGLVSHQVDSLVAAEQAFGDLKQLQKALELYIHDSQYKQFIMSSAAAPIDESSYKVITLTQAQSDAVRADFLADVRRTSEARALLESILKTDPDNVQAHETMGSLEFQEGHREEARKWYGEAVKLGSRNFLVHFFYAVLTEEQDGAKQSQQIEASLRTAIRLNSRYAPAYDRLAAFLAERHEHLDEAHLFNNYAIKLDSSNLGYRLNAANVLVEAQRYADATAVLKGALKIAKTPVDSAMVQSRVDEIATFQADRARVEAMAAQPDAKAHDQAGKTVQVQEPVTVVPTPKHPTMPANGPKHSFEGVIRGVVCSYPLSIEFRVEGAKKVISLYNNNFSKIDLSVLGFTPPAEMNPCKNFEGMKARVQFVDSSDKSVAGQVVAVILKK